MRISIDTTEIEALAVGLRGFSDRRLQSGIAEALNKTARAVADEWAGQMALRIDRPTSLTRRAVLVKRADVGALKAEVMIKDRLEQSGLPPSEYLAPHEFGGDRSVKKFERALQSRGAMPSRSKVVPGEYAKLDGYGNISRGQIVQVLNQLGVGAGLSVGYKRVIGATAAVRARSAARAGRKYVALPQERGALAAGIYERQGEKLLPVFFFVTRTHYRKRLALMEHGQRIVQRELESQVWRAIDKRWQSLQARGGGAA